MSKLAHPLLKGHRPFADKGGTKVTNPMHRPGFAAFKVCDCGLSFTALGLSRHWDHCKDPGVQAKRKKIRDELAARSLGSKFKPGDRVRVIDKRNAYCGKVGVVRNVYRMTPGVGPDRTKVAVDLPHSRTKTMSVGVAFEDPQLELLP